MCPSDDSISPCKCNNIGESYGCLTLDCADQKLGDERISQILNYFLPAEEKLSEIILCNNNLSKIPDEIRQFNYFSRVDLRFNQIRKIGSGAFKFPDKVNKSVKLYLSSNQINEIESGAFQGIISCSKKCFDLFKL